MALSQLNSTLCLAILMLMSGALAQNPGCPKPSDIAPCTCFSEVAPPVGYNVYLYCEGADHLDLKAMFQRLSTTVTDRKFYRLRLTNSRIVILPADMFGEFQFTEIEIFGAHSLQRVNTRAFAGPVASTLRRISIADTPIFDGNGGDYDLFKALANVTNLYELSIINTSLTTIPTNGLPSAPMLEKVVITGNTRLTSIGSGALKLNAGAINLSPSGLASLNISGNPLASRPMSSHTFSGITKGSSVSLYAYGDGFRYLNRTVFEPYLSSSTKHTLYSDTDCADSLMDAIHLFDDIAEDIKPTVRLVYAFDDSGGDNLIYITANGCHHNAYGLGSNANGQLGLGHNQPVLSPQLIPQLTNRDIISIHHGLDFAAAVTDTGHVYTWGHNPFGQLGRESTRRGQYHAPEPIATFNCHQVLQISCGSEHTLALTTAGEVYGWGSNSWGQVGCGLARLCEVPAPWQLRFPNDNHRIVAVMCGQNTSYALTTDGRVFSWGCNQSGQLGHDNCGLTVYTPALVTTLTVGVKDICPINTGAYMLATDGVLYFCGRVCPPGADLLGPIVKRLEMGAIVDDIRQVVCRKGTGEPIVVALVAEKVCGIYCGTRIEYTDYHSLDEFFAHEYQLTCRAISLPANGGHSVADESHRWTSESAEFLQNITDRVIRLNECLEKQLLNNATTMNAMEKMPIVMIEAPIWPVWPLNLYTESVTQTSYLSVLHQDKSQHFATFERLLDHDLNGNYNMITNYEVNRWQSFVSRESSLKCIELDDCIDTDVNECIKPVKMSDNYSNLYTKISDRSNRSVDLIEFYPNLAETADINENKSYFDDIMTLGITGSDGQYAITGTNGLLTSGGSDDGRYSGMKCKSYPLWRLFGFNGKKMGANVSKAVILYETKLKESLYKTISDKQLSIDEIRSAAKTVRQLVHEYEARIRSSTELTKVPVITVNPRSPYNSTADKSNTTRILTTGPAVSRGPSVMPTGAGPVDHVFSPHTCVIDFQSVCFAGKLQAQGIGADITTADIKLDLNVQQMGRRLWF
ncbi:unnamed protein product [Medioppia subpectinata]|uniref:RCC1-like domain-containing protein n=1 Tax=Medioppia subpectinata TaxID=1979941 RepID=A0A7R9PW70_9ACAR|nr:unnamed protein product [Medioppia subpectinata]CAG2103611.1 unnamed protein product [Medioppia subpectinata]